jgi:hypothetical protein
MTTLLLLLLLYSLLLGLDHYFSFLILHTVDYLHGDEPIAKALPIHKNTHTHRINTHIHTSMPLVGFEPTTPVFERERTVHALVGAGTVIGLLTDYMSKILRIIVISDCCISRNPIWIHL